MLQKVNRRQFLKRVGAACAAAVTVPVALVQSQESVAGIDCNSPIKWATGNRRVTMTEFVMNMNMEYDIWHRSNISQDKSYGISYWIDKP